MSSQIGKTRELGTWFFFSFTPHIAYAPNHPALLGDARWTENKIREMKFQNYRRRKFGPCCLLACISISLHFTENKFKSESNNLQRFSYSWGHRLKIVHYLAETEIHWKWRRQQDLYRMYVTFLAPLGSTLQITFNRSFLKTVDCGGAVYLVSIFFLSYVFYCGTSETINLCYVCGKIHQFVST